LELSVKALELSAAPAPVKSDPMQVTIHNYPGKEPEVKADFSPIINLPAPVVNVTNDVYPSEVAVQNNVTAVPGEMTLNMPPAEKKSARVTRGRDGKIDGIDEV
jgi:hypothetical protein